jgi:hypothetical protein
MPTLTSSFPTGFGRAGSCRGPPRHPPSRPPGRPRRLAGAGSLGRCPGRLRVGLLCLVWRGESGPACGRVGGTVPGDSGRGGAWAESSSHPPGDRLTPLQSSCQRKTGESVSPVSRATPRRRPPPHSAKKEVPPPAHVVSPITTQARRRDRLHSTPIGRAVKTTKPEGQGRNLLGRSRFLPPLALSRVTWGLAGTAPARRDR